MTRLEFLEPVFRLDELGFVSLDLGLDEAARIFGVTLFGARSRIHEQIHRGVDQALGSIGIATSIGKLKEVAR